MTVRHDLLDTANGLKLARLALRTLEGWHRGAEERPDFSQHEIAEAIFLHARYYSLAAQHTARRMLTELNDHGTPLGCAPVQTQAKREPHTLTGWQK